MDNGTIIGIAKELAHMAHEQEVKHNLFDMRYMSTDSLLTISNRIEKECVQLSNKMLELRETLLHSLKQIRDGLVRINWDEGDAHEESERLIEEVKKMRSVIQSIMSEDNGERHE